MTPTPESSKIRLGTERVENELKEDLKNKKLIAGSINITPSPTNKSNKSVGYVDPEKFRLGAEPKANQNMP